MEADDLVPHIPLVPDLAKIVCEFVTCNALDLYIVNPLRDLVPNMIPNSKILMGIDDEHHSEVEEWVSDHTGCDNFPDPEAIYDLHAAWDPSSLKVDFLALEEQDPAYRDRDDDGEYHNVADTANNEEYWAFFRESLQFANSLSIELKPFNLQILNPEIWKTASNGFHYVCRIPGEDEMALDVHE
jgi:hypothetical protein